MAQAQRFETPRLSRAEIAAAALKSATENDSVANYQAIFEGFSEKGIELEDIEPRVNVFTYNAWLAKGRQVRAGEKGVRIVGRVRAAGQVSEDGESSTKGYSFPKGTSVFHVSQTDPIEPKRKG